MAHAGPTIDDDARISTPIRSENDDQTPLEPEREREREREDGGTITLDPPAERPPKRAFDTGRDTPTDREPNRPTRWHVVLHDDDHHTYGYVMGMLCGLFGKSIEESWDMARRVDAHGRVICDTTVRERAEFKRDQILAWGPDPLIEASAGSMTATIEPCFDDKG